MRKMMIGIIVALLSLVLCAGIGYADGGTSEATLQWDYPTTNVDGSLLTDLAGFKIYFGTSPGNYTTSIDVGFATCITTPPCSSSKYTVTNLSIDTIYYFAATAYDISANESSYSNEVSKTIGAPPPVDIPAPTGIQASTNGGTVTLSWDKPNYADIAGYQISRGTTAGLHNNVYDVGAAQPTASPCVINYTGCIRKQFILNGVNPGAYYFAVKGYDSQGNLSAYSNEVSLTLSSDATQPADVTNFTAMPYGTGIRLSWTNPSNPDFSSLILSFSTTSNSGPWTKIADLKGIPSTNQTYDHLNLVKGKIYYYKIQTKDTSGNTTSTRHVEMKLELPPEERCPANADLSIYSSSWMRIVSLEWTWPYDQNIATGTVEYRIASYQNRVLLTELTSKPCWVMHLTHNYTERLIGESIEYTLTFLDKNGKKVYQTSKTLFTPKDLSGPPDGMGGGGPENVEWVAVTDNAEKDFPKPQQSQLPQKKKSSGFGCGTITNAKPPDDGSDGTDVSVLALATTLLLFLTRRKLCPQIN